ncbi:MAG TPA: D-arabinono-1,4-lactone oxidase, partial [Polyangiales bacterium]|nr:D-arabinono-1,4-lactone oxidase [Polyangiales bacterium]
LAADNLSEMLSLLEEYDREYLYSVATVDVYGKGANLGRGVIAFGDHATRGELPANTDPLKVSPPPRLSVPFELPELTLNRLSIRAVNAFVQLTQKRLEPIGHYEGFFYPLDMLGHWNRGYGRRGFAQYQFVIPFEDGEARMRHILDFIFASGELPFLNVLKRMGKQSGGVLSFPREGYTFAIDFPIRDHTVAVLRELDKLVVEAGGRIYLGKDSVVEADTFRAMYPAIDAWLAVKQKYDPNNVFTSDLARRVGLLSA